MSRVKILIVPAIVGLAMVMAPTNSVLAQGEKVTLCHLDQETQEVKMITIGTGAVAAHLAHGDSLDLTRCQDDGAKVEICHVPPDNPDNAHTISVGSEDAVADHLGHGDTEGPCVE